jgi:hypothetical protein
MFTFKTRRQQHFTWVGFAIHPTKLEFTNALAYYTVVYATFVKEFYGSHPSGSLFSLHCIILGEILNFRSKIFFLTFFKRKKKSFNVGREKKFN